MLNKSWRALNVHTWTVETKIQKILLFPAHLVHLHKCRELKRIDFFFSVKKCFFKRAFYITKLTKLSSSPWNLKKNKMKKHRNEMFDMMAIRIRNSDGNCWYLKWKIPRSMLEKRIACIDVGSASDSVGSDMSEASEAFCWQA